MRKKVRKADIPAAGLGTRFSAGDKGAAERNAPDRRQTSNPIIHCRRGRRVRN